MENQVEKTPTKDIPVWTLTVLGLCVLALGLAYHLRPNQEIANCYFDVGEEIGHSQDGRKWVIEKRLNEYSLVWQIKPDGHLFWKPPISPSRFNTRFRTFRDEVGSMTLSIADDSEIMALGDSTIIYFKSDWKIAPIRNDTL